MTKLFKILLAVCFIGCSFGSSAQTMAPFKFMVLGDMPYNIPDDYARYEQLIAQINQQKPSFTIFVGDTKSGSTPCSDEYNQKVKSYFDRYDSPLIYSIGDNEWTDCHRPLAGSYDPLERLSDLRLTFFNSKKSLGKRKIDLIR